MRQIEPKPLRVLLAYEPALIRAGLRALLQRIRNVQVVAEAGDGPSAVTAAATAAPDIALLDHALPKLNGLATTARIVRSHPSIKIILLTPPHDPAFARSAQRVGAAGTLPKAPPPRAETALRSVARGVPYFTSDAPLPSPEPDFVPPHGSELTARQNEVLRLIAEGHSTKDVAAHLGLSAKTIEAHRAQIMTRLGIHHLSGLVRHAMRQGLIPPEPATH